MANKPLPISAYIICRNEVSYLGPCIESLSACKEIVVVDSGSDDGTLELIESFRRRGYPIRVFHNEWPGYAIQKQFALTKCTQPWCLSLDADERLDGRLQQELEHLIAAPADVAAWRLDFRLALYSYGYVPLAVRYGAAVRLTRNGRAHYDTGRLVHESMEVDGVILTAKKGRILHFRALPIDQQIVKEKNYAKLKSEQLFLRKKSPRLFRMILNPLIYFVRIFFVKRFFLCGWAGFIHASTGAMYAFMTEALLYQKIMASRSISDSAEK